MACANAKGIKMSPMLIVKGKTSASLHGFNTSVAPPGAKWAYQEKGWINDELGEKWFKDVFLAECGEHRPQLLLLDGHSSHESLSILEAAMEEGIHILCFPPHTTHCLQPLDRAVFGPFNKGYDTACSEFLSENPLHLVNKWTFPALFKTAWEAALTPRNITSGFRACGIYPLNQDAIPSAMFLPSLPSNVELLPSTVSCPPETASGSSTPSNTSNPDVTAPTSAVSTTGSSMPASSMQPENDLESMVSGQTRDLLDSSAIESPDAGIGALADSDALEILSLISDGSYNVVATADEHGNAEIPDSSIFASTASVPDPNIESSSPTYNELSMWNTALNEIFLPTPPAPRSQPKKTKAKTSHRLLTSAAIIAEKKVLAEKKEQKLNCQKMKSKSK